MAIVRKMQSRRDTAANWTSSNPILASGERGLETNTRREKIGNGTTAWADLPYVISDNLLRLDGTAAEQRAALSVYSQAAIDAALAAIPAASITSGTLSDNRLSSNVPLKNAANTWAENQIFQKPITVRDGSGNDVFDVATNQIRFRSASAGYLLGPSGQLIGGEDTGGFYFGMGFTSTNKPIYLGHALTSQIIANAELISARTNALHVRGLNGSGWAPLVAGNTTINGDVSIGSSIVFNGTVGVMTANNAGTGRLSLGANSYIQADTNEMVVSQRGSGSLYQDFGTSTIFRRNSDFSTRATLDSAGNLTTQGAITTQNGRPVKLDFGTTIYKGDLGGYILGSVFRGPANTDLGMMGVYGSNNELVSYFIGLFDNQVASFNASTKEATFNGNVRINGPAISKFKSIAGAATTLDLSDGQVGDFKNTISGDVRRYVNDGGTMKSILYV